MSMDPAMIQQMLALKLQQANSGGAPQNGTSMTPRTNAAQALSQMAQQALLAKALQNRQQGLATPFQGMQANAGMAPANAQMANDPTMQAMQQSPSSSLTPEQLQQLQSSVNPATAIPQGVS